MSWRGGCEAGAPYATRFRYPSANFAIEPLTAEFVEALNHAQRVYDFVLMFFSDRGRT